MTINDETLGDGELYLEQMYDNIGFGYDKKFGNTAMVVIDMYTREVIIVGFGEAEAYLNSDRIHLMINKMTPFLSDGDYNTALTKFIKLSSQYMKINPSLNPDNLFLKLWFQAIISFVIGLVVVAIMAFQSGGKITVNEETYLDHNDSKILAKQDDYIRTTLTKVQKPKPTNTGSGSGGGLGGGTSSGGHSHSSGRGSF